MKSFFNYANSVADSTELMSKEKFYEIMNSNLLNYRCGLIEKETDKEKRQKMKRYLPIILYNASFPKGNRKNEDAVPSGMMMLDLDHTEESPKAIFERIKEKAINEYGLLVANISISGTGLRLVLPVPEGLSIAQGMNFYEQALNLPSVDPACKDLARSSFAVPRKNYLYIDEETLFGDKELKKVVAEPSLFSQPEQKKATEGKDVFAGHGEKKEETSGTTTTQLIREWDGISLTSIAQELEEQLGGKPAEGDRNNFYFKMACHLKAICPDAESLLECLPDYDLPEDERVSSIASALKTPKEGQTQSLKRAIAVARGLIEAEDGSCLPQWPSDLPLPSVIELLTRNAPQKTKPCIAGGVFPALGTYLFGTKFQLLDGNFKEPSFMHLTIADQSSGKSAQNKPIAYIMEDIRRRDDEGRKELDEYKKKAKKRSAQESLPDEPHPIIQYLPSDITAAAFSLRLRNAQGRYLFNNYDESRMIDDLGMNGKRDIGKIICEAFNQCDVGQDRVGCESVTSFTPLRWNWSAQCTYGVARAKFDKYAGSGELTCLNIATVVGWDPDYKFGVYDEQWKSELKPYLENLKNACGLGEIECQEALAVAKECEDIYEEKYALSCDQFYRTWGPRAVVIAQSKAVLLWLANGMKWEDSIANFCKWSFEYDIACKKLFFGKAFELALEKEKVTPHRGKQNLLTYLPEVFTTEQAKQVRLDNKLSEDPRQMIANWTFRKYIELTEDGKYKKLPQQKAS